MAYLRLGLAVAGLGVALLAIGFDDRRLGWAAIALLVASLAVRMARRNRHPPV